MSQRALRLQLVPDEPDQMLRLARFRQEHPGVIIGEGEFGTWQARILEPNGEVFTTRHTLRELLDRLDELTGQQDQESAQLLRPAPGGTGGERRALPRCRPARHGAGCDARDI